MEFRRALPISVEADRRADRRHRPETTADRRPEEAQSVAYRGTDVAGDVDTQNGGAQQRSAVDPAAGLGLGYQRGERHRHRMQHRLLVDAVKLGVVDQVAEPCPRGGRPPPPAGAPAPRAPPRPPPTPENR